MPEKNAHSEKEDEDILEDSISLNLPRRQGQKAIQLLRKLGLMSKTLAPNTEQDLLKLPLSRSPSPGERRQLAATLNDEIITHGMFSSKSQSTGSLDELLQKELPSDIIPLVSKSFDVIGDIAIIELSPSAQAFEKKIAETLMKVHKNVKTVFSKAGPITDIERVRPLHYILGDNKTETMHREHGCVFKVDVSKAFFSPRLSAEHERVARQVGQGERVVDMFAGVGPFSIIIAKRLSNVRIDSIDANVEAAKLIKENAEINKVQSKIKVWQGDARAIVGKSLLHAATRVVMNHPSQAREFVRTACKALRPDTGIIHYYTFADGMDPESKAEKELSSSLASSGWTIEEVLTTQKVRGVAPMKWQIAVDAKLNRS